LEEVALAGLAEMAVSQVFDEFFNLGVLHVDMGGLKHAG
jgi:hypothetical protein